MGKKSFTTRGRFNLKFEKKFERTKFEFEMSIFQVRELSGWNEL